MADSSNFPWPAQHRAAVSVVVVVHANAGSSGLTGDDYAATGLQRIAQTLADLDVPATFAFSATALPAMPQLARTALDLGHELAALGKTGEDHERVWAHISDIRPDGVVRDNASNPNDDPYPFTWQISGMSGDFPVQTGESGQVTIPVSPYWRDDRWLDPQRPLPPSSLLEAWSIGLASMRTIGGIMTVILHPHIAGRPGFIEQIVRFVDEVIESGDVWLATAGQIAAWTRQRESATTP